MTKGVTVVASYRAVTFLGAHDTTRNDTFMSSLMSLLTRLLKNPSEKRKGGKLVVPILLLSKKRLHEQPQYRLRSVLT